MQVVVDMLLVHFLYSDFLYADVSLIEFDYALIKLALSGPNQILLGPNQI